TRKIKRVTLNLWLDEYITEHGDDLDHQAEEIDEEIRAAEAKPAHESAEAAEAHEFRAPPTHHHHDAPGHHA
ncbi:MAG TPA: hypothetical protein VE965_02300, partial [Gammaproteobacteria bacterium]|nr:hypothetical protein [Gammaproteobacteria bacterium]